MIDDDENAIVLAKKLIENVGYNFYGAPSILKAKEMIKEYAPHFLILDIKLDHEDGFSFLNERERNEHYSKMPVLVLTQMKQDKLLQQILSYKGADYLAKPIQPALLLQKIKKNLKLVDTKQFVFDPMERPSVIATIAGEIIKISEVAMIIESPMKLNQEEEILVKSEMLDDLNISTKKMAVKKKSTSGVEGGYDTEVVMLGVTEESAQKIRRIRRVKE